MSFSLPRVSPDGRHVALLGTEADGTSRIYVRNLDDGVEARPLAGTEGAHNPFWAPDSRSLGFFDLDEGMLKRLDLAGGAVVNVTRTAGYDGSWGANGTLVFDVGGAELMQVSDHGGTPTPATAPDEGGEMRARGWPEFLPDGRHFLYMSTVNDADHQLHVGDVESLADVVVALTGSRRAVYAWPGYLLYVRHEALVAQPFDAGSLRTTGEAVPLIQDVDSLFSASQNGVLVIRRGGGSSRLSRLAWIDRDGVRRDAFPDDGYYLDAALSPGGDRVAVTVRREAASDRSDIWMLDVPGGGLSRLTFDPEAAGVAVWSPDGRRIAHAARRSGVLDLYISSSLDRQEPELLLSTPSPKIPRSWSRDGRFILYVTQQPATGFDLWTVRADGSEDPQPLVATGDAETYGAFSPDGRYVVYESQGVEGPQIYVQDFPPTGRRWQVSTEGGREPLWTADGSAIQYLSADASGTSSGALMSVTVEATDPLRLGAPQALFEIQASRRLGYTYSPSADGHRMMFIVPEAPPEVPAIDVYVNWQRLLER